MTCGSKRKEPSVPDGVQIEGDQARRRGRRRSACGPQARDIAQTPARLDRGVEGPWARGAEPQARAEAWARKLKPLQAADEKRSAIASLVNRPCLRAFWFALGAPEPRPPPCMRQRFLPCTAGELHAPPERVLAPHRGLASIGPVFLMFAHACAFRLAAAAPCPRSEPKAEWSLCAASS